MRKKLAVAAFLLLLASAATPALGIAPPGLHKAPAATNVPSSVCARCHTG